MPDSKDGSAPPTQRSRSMSIAIQLKKTNQEGFEEFRQKSRDTVAIISNKNNSIHDLEQSVDVPETRRRQSEMEEVMKKTPSMAPVDDSATLDAGTAVWMNEQEWRRNHKYPNILYVVENNYFESAISSVILFNCITIGLQADTKEGEEGGGLGLSIFEIFFTGVFLVEVILRSLVYGFAKYYLGSIWAFLDLALVLVTGILISWILIPLGVGGGFTRTLQVLRALRLMRAARAVKSLPAFKQMWLLCSGVMESTKILAWTVAVIVYILYTFAVFFTEVIGHSAAYPEGVEDVQDLFSSIGMSMFTLLQIMFLDRAFLIIREVTMHQPFAWILFLIFIFLVSLILTRVILSIVVDNALNTAREEEMMDQYISRKKRREIILRIKNLFTDIDTNLDGDLSVIECEHAFQKPEIRSQMSLIGFTPEDLTRLWNIMDKDGNGSIDLQEFLKGVEMTEGKAKNADIVSIRRRIINLDEKFQSYSKSVDRTITRICQKKKEVFRLTQDLDDIAEMMTLQGTQRRDKQRQMILNNHKVAGTRPPPVKDADVAVLIRDHEEMPSICRTSRGTGRLVTLPSLVRKEMKIDDHTECVRDQNNEDNIDLEIAISNITKTLLKAGLSRLDVEPNTEIDSKAFVTAMRQIGIPDDISSTAFRKIARERSQVSASNITHAISEQQDQTVIPFKYAIMKVALSSLYDDFDELLDFPNFGAALEQAGVSSRDTMVIFEVLEINPDGTKPVSSRKGYTSANKLFMQICSREEGGSLAAALSLKEAFLKFALASQSLKFDMSLRAADFEQKMVTLGASRVQAKSIRQKMDNDGDGIITVQEFLLCLQTSSTSSDLLDLVKNLLKQTFTELDVDKNSNLTLDEFINVMHRIGIKRTAALKTFSLIDEDQNGELSVDEFIEGIVSNKNIVQSNKVVCVRYPIFRFGLKIKEEKLSKNKIWDQAYFDILMKMYDCAESKAKYLWKKVKEEAGDGAVSSHLFCRLCCGSEKLDTDPQFANVKLQIIADARESMKLEVGGKLTKNKFVEIMEQYAILREDAESFYDEVDQDGDDDLTFSELQRALCSGSSIVSEPNAMIKLRLFFLRKVFRSFYESCKMMQGVSSRRMDKDSFTTCIVKVGGDRSEAEQVYEVLMRTQKELTWDEFSDLFAVVQVPKTDKHKLDKWMSVKTIIYKQLFRVFPVLHEDCNLNLTDFSRILESLEISKTESVKIFNWIDENQNGTIDGIEILKAFTGA